MRRGIAFLLFVLVVVGVFFLGRVSAKAVAKPQGGSVKGCTVPKAWGSYKGNISGAIVGFEDSAGTVRGYNIDNCTGGEGGALCTIRRQ